MGKRQASGTDAKELFVKYFGPMMETAAHRGYDGESTKREDFMDLCHIDNGDLREIVMGFSLEFMNKFNLGIRQSGDNFFIDRVGRVGRPKGAKNKPKKAAKDEGFEHVEKPATVNMTPTPAPQLVQPASRVVHELHAGEEEIFGTCPKCGSITMHEPHAKGHYKCQMCNHINKRKDIQ